MADPIMPFGFTWCYEDEEEGELCTVLQVGSTDEATPLHIDITNILEASKDITLHGETDPGVEPSPENYHFKIVLNPGLLSNPANIAISTDNWHLAAISNADTDTLYLLWKGADIVLAPNDSMEIILTGVAATLAEKETTTNITIAWQVEDEISIGRIIFQVPPPPGGDYATNHTIELTMIKTTGKSNIPLFVGFVSSNRVLNINDGTTNLQLRITNTNLPNGDDSHITFHYDSNPSACSQLVVVLEVGTAVDVPWALGTLDQVNAVQIAIDGDQWQQNGGTEQIIVGGIVTALQWTFMPKTADVVLQPQQTMKINLNGIVTAHPTGQANLYLRYQYVSGYKDGQFICSIEKAPLVFADKNVGISTNDTSAPGNLNLGNTTRQMINLYEQDYGIGVEPAKLYLRTGADFALYKGGVDTDPNSGTTQMVVNKDGNVGIGTTSPSAKLDVDGWIKGHGAVTTGMILMWSGTPSDIPTGWVICDGQNSTPDLRDKFIVGAGGGYAKGNTGGIEQQTLTVEQMPKHNHEVRDKGHSHQLPGTTGAFDLDNTAAPRINSD